MAFLSLLVAVLVALAVLRRPSLTIRGIAPFVAVVALAGLAALRWYYHRPQPGPAREALFRGVSYEREVRTSPRPLVVHVVTIDLRDPSISFVVTPEDRSGGMEVRAATTSGFLIRHGAQLAINGDFFLPWWSNGPSDFYPHVGDPVYVRGAAVSEGREYGHREVPFSSLLIGQDGAVSIVDTSDPAAPLPRARYAVSGKQVIVSGGARTAVVFPPIAEVVRHPRTAAALDRSRARLLLFAVDGRQPGYSEGVTIEELAGIVIEHGGWTAMNLDGGGSTAIAIDDGEGGTRLLNCPFHTRIPWRERPVANHLGVFAAPL